MKNQKETIVGYLFDLYHPVCTCMLHQPHMPVAGTCANMLHTDTLPAQYSMTRMSIMWQKNANLAAYLCLLDDSLFNATWLLSFKVACQQQQEKDCQWPQY